MIVEVLTHPAGVAAEPGTGEPRVVRAATLDPDVRALLQRLNLYPLRPTSAYSLRRGRRDWQLAIKAFGSRDPVMSVSERLIPGPAGDLRLRIYVPEEGPDGRPVLAWIHGGGFILGDLYTAGATCRALARRSGAIVVAIEYRLAPEHDLHAGLEDCLCAGRWLAGHADTIGGDPARLAVGGDSAGGALAARVAQRAAALDVPLVLQVLVYPATDLGGEYPSHSENATGYMLTGEHIAWFRRHIGEASDIHDPALSPLQAPDVSGLAPALVVTAGFDPLRDEGLAYAARLREAAVGVRSLHYADHIHGFMSFDRVLRGGRDALDRIAASVAHTFAAGAFEPSVDGVYVDDGRSSSNGLTGAAVRQRWNEARVTQILAADLMQDHAFSVASRTWNLMTRAGPGSRR